MPFRTRLTQLLGIEHPILLAPMGSVSGGALAAAVSAAGGLGLIGLGYGDPEWLEREFVAAGPARIGCGFITWSLARRPELLARTLAYRPAAVMLSFGDPAPFAGSIKEAGAALICQVQTVAQALEALTAGADAIVAQGAEAGGHGATRATLPLVPAVVDALRARGSDVPVVAAGGIADGRGLAAALALGADGRLLARASWRAASRSRRRWRRPVWWRRVRMRPCARASSIWRADWIDQTATPAGR
jgi:nitronate monooxygenase